MPPTKSLAATAALDLAICADSAAVKPCFGAAACEKDGATKAAIKIKLAVNVFTEFSPVFLFSPIRSEHCGGKYFKDKAKNTLLL